MRDGNARWARYVDRLIARRYEGSQAALARDMAVSASTISRWLTGSSPDIKHVRAISRVAGVPLRDLLVEAFQLAPEDLSLDGVAVDGPASGRVPFPETSEFEKDEDFVVVVEAWPWLSEEDRASVRHIALRFASQRRGPRRRGPKPRNRYT
jgi:transcriptional regulator with XRE-family HTH domain